MENTKKDLSNFRTLADTSSVVAHDLCAQLHVMQFCLEEMNDHISPEGREYLRRMRDSTSYISQLMDSFRRGLKLKINDEDSFTLESIYDGTLELIKNHYFIVIEKVTFEHKGKLGSFEIKNNCKRFMNSLFTVYSFFLDEVKADDEGKLRPLMHLKVKAENTRFVRVTLSVTGETFDKEWFMEKLNSSVAEKGRMRQYLGATILREEMAKNEDLLRFAREDDETHIEFHLPLKLEE